MTTGASTVNEYLSELPEERQKAIDKLRKVVKKNLPKGFEETMNYGMIGYVVPNKIFPAGYHCDPRQPLPFMNIASQKNFIAIYHMGLYSIPSLLKWFTDAYAKAGVGKLDMGKSCIRFKKPENIPYELIGELASKLSVSEWVGFYQSNLAARKK